MRIYQIPEGIEGKDMAGFVKKLLNDMLNLASEMDIKIERAHRSLTSKPADLAVPPWSIIARFLDAAVKDVSSSDKFGARVRFTSKKEEFSLTKITLLTFRRKEQKSTKSSNS